MSRFVTRSVERFELGDGDYVDLRTRLSYGDRLAIQEKLLAGNSPSALEKADGVQFNLTEGNLEVLVRSITSWGGPGFCTRDHPHDGEHQIRAITRDAIAALDETGERILSEIGQRQRTRTPDFPMPPSQRTSATGAEEDQRPVVSLSSHSSSGSAGTTTS